MNKGLFLDRDGVINVERNYVYRIEDFEFVDGIFDLCAKAQTHGFNLVVITNQAGIARGYYTEGDYERLTAWMLDQFASRGIRIDRVYYCPFHPTAGIGEYRRESFDRKPNPGMILRAQKDLDLDLSRSVLVGDKDSDIEAGRAAGVKYNLKLLHGLPPAPGRLEFSSLHAIRQWLEKSLGW
jgi:D-glycero-D-manno-heptose 1,7-bisphosphate phosphatase